MAAPHPASRHAKTLEKIFTSLRASCDKKLDELNENYTEQKEWLRTSVVNTKEKKDVLGLVNPPTARKVKKTSSRLAAVETAGEKENNANGRAARHAKLDKAKTAAAHEAPACDQNLKTPNEEETIVCVSVPELEEKQEKQVSSHTEFLNASAQKQEDDIPQQVWTIKDFQKLKVAELREELQIRGLLTSGLKEELITRLIQPYSKDNCLVGRDTLPKMGMRVRHINGPNHGSSKGMGGMIEYIPGRGAFRIDERSVSVRWDADKSDVRGPYYTGEPCDRGSGIGTPKFDLLCLDLNPERIVEKSGTTPDKMEFKPSEIQEFEPAVVVDDNVGRSDAISGLQEDDSDKPTHVFHSEVIASEHSDMALPDIDSTTSMESAPSSVPETEPVSIPTSQSRGSKRSFDGAPVQSCKKSKSPVATEPQSASSASHPSETSASSFPASLQAKLDKCKAAFYERQTAAPSSSNVSTCANAPSCSKPEQSTGQVSESVQQFRAIISRINGEARTASGAEAAHAGTPSSSSRASMPRPAPADQGLSHEAAAAKPTTWPLPVRPSPYRPVDLVRADGTRSSSSSLTAEALMAHTQMAGRVDPVQAMSFDGADGRERMSSISAVGGAYKGGAAQGSDSRAAMSAAAQQRLDLAARQQRAAENRAAQEEEAKRKALEAERKRKELAQKRAEEQRAEADRRLKEAQVQKEKLEAARVRAQQEEELRQRKLQEQEQERRRQEQEQRRAEQERLDREREEKERAVAAAKAAAAAAPQHGGSGQASGSKGGGGILGVLGSIIPGWGQAPKPAPPTPAAAAEESGPTSIQIITEKNSDDSESEDEGAKKVFPAWTKSPVMRAQLLRQDGMSPTPIFGECKKTCDLQAMFVNHQPKRRRYDKRTSSADWGDDHRASFMEEDRFQRAMLQQMHAQQQQPAKSSRV